jgi:hypothetical protein
MPQIYKNPFLAGTPHYIIRYMRVSHEDYLIVADNPLSTPEEILEAKKWSENDYLLGTVREMTEVWKQLMELERPSSQSIWDSALSDFIRALHVALHGQSTWSALTPKARTTKHNEIIRTMRHLAKDIKYYDLDQLEKVHNIFNNNEGAHVRSDDDAHDSSSFGEFTSYRDLYDNQTGIQISDLLQKHADKLEHQNRYLAPLTSKTTGERGLLHFIRTFAAYNMTRYGKHYGALISRIATVYFRDSDTSPEKIRASIHALNL